MSYRFNNYIDKTIKWKCRTDLIIKQIKQLKIHRQGDKNLNERKMNSSSTRVQKRNNFKSK